MRLLSHALAVVLVIDVFIMEIEFLEFYRDYCAGLDEICKMQLLWVYGGLIEFFYYAMFAILIINIFLLNSVKYVLN